MTKKFSTGYVEVPLENLTKAEWNYKKNNKQLMDKLIGNLSTNGQIETIIIRELGDSYEVVNGNHRLDAMKALDFKTAMCYNLGDITENKAKRIAIETNETKFDSDKVKFDKVIMDLLDDFTIDDLASSMPISELELEEIQDIKMNLNNEPPNEDEALLEDDFDETITHTIDIQQGDLFTIGRHRLLCGDATVKENYTKLMNGELANLLLTDPPYNTNIEGSNDEKLKIENDNMEESAFIKLLTDSFANCFDNMEKGASYYIWYAQLKAFEFLTALRSVKQLPHEGLVWAKGTMVMGRQDYQWKHEMAYYGWKEGAPHKWYSDRKQTTVLEFDKPARNKNHPTMKPINMMGYLIRNSSRKDELVLDVFLGSGSTMVACEQTERTCYGMELSPEYCYKILHRMKKLVPEIEIMKNGLPFEVITEI